MNTYLALFVISVCSSLVLTPLIRRLSERRGWFDEPRDDRRVHKKPIPRLGGIAIFLSVLVALSLLLFLNNTLTSSLKASSIHLYTTLGLAFLILVLGVFDDLHGTTAIQKFSAQGLISLLFFMVGGRIETVTIPFIGSTVLPWGVSFALTAVWLIGVTNAFNLIDGIDGLAAGAALFASLVMLVVSFTTGQFFVTVIAIALAGALIGFLRYNFNPASIFLGDSGSLFIGFTLAALSLQGTEKAPTAIAISIPLLAFGVPVIDTSFSIVRRFLSGRPLFAGDREHIHHMLLARGWSQRKVVLCLYGACAAFGLLSLLFVGGAGRATGFMLLIIGVAVVFAIGRLRYHEVDEIKAGMKRNFAERRQRMANNIHVRRTSRALSQAMTLNELFAAIQEMLQVGEFVFATVRIGRGACDGDTHTAFAHEKLSTALRRVVIRDGVINWSWERGDIEEREIIGSGRFWSLRLPISTERAGLGYINLYREFDSDGLLLDVNYLCGIFQKELAQAVENVLDVKEQDAGAARRAAKAAAG